jgi:hypothetical protein
VAACGVLTAFIKGLSDGRELFRPLRPFDGLVLTLVSMFATMKQFGCCCELMSIAVVVLRSMVRSIWCCTCACVHI